MLRVVRLRVVFVALPVDDVVPPHVAPFGPLDVLASSADDQHCAYIRALRQRLVDGRLECACRATPIAPVRCNDDAGIGVLDPALQRVSGEPTEDHRMRSSQSGTGEHRDRRLGDHRHVDRDPVALANAQFRQGVCGPAHLTFEIGVGDRAGVAGLPFPVQGHLVPVPSLDMPVDAVVADVERTTDEPSREGAFRPVQHLGPL